MPMTAVSIKSTTNPLTAPQIAIESLLSSSTVVFQGDNRHNEVVLPCTAIIITDAHGESFARAVASLKHFESVLVIATAANAQENEYERAGVTSVVLRPGIITDFAAVRNEAMQHVSSEWCFFLDSDEVLDTPAKESVDTLETYLHDEQVSGVSVRRSDIFLGKRLSYGEAGRQLLVRFMRVKNTTWEGQAHERPVILGDVKESELTLSHYSHESINLFIADIASYAKIIASERQTTAGANLLQLLLFPPLKLVYDLIVLGGVLDGWRGVTYSYCMALHSLLVRIYAYEKRTQLASQANSVHSR